MSSLLHPVGPRRPAVYWRRRVVLLLAVTALVVLVAMLTGGDGQAGGRSSAAPAAQPTPTPTASEPTDEPTDGPTDEPTDGPTDEPTDEPSDAADAPACEEGDVRVAVVPDAAAYSTGEVPQFTVSVTTTGEEACSVDLGSTDAVALQLASGSDAVWSSSHCGGGVAEGSGAVTLEPGEREEQSVTWQRVRSDEGCPDDLESPAAGTYRVTATVAGVSSEPATFTLD